MFSLLLQQENVKQMVICRPLTRLHNDMLSGAASQFFCTTVDDDTTMDMNSNGGFDSCVFRDDTEVILEMTTRDMMESGDLLDWTSDIGG